MVDDRQFFIGQERYKDWNTAALSCGKVLSCQEKLTVHANENNSVILLGDAWQVMPDRQPPREIIKTWTADTADEEIYEQEESWCGKYVLIVGTRLFLDAICLLPAFYDADGNVSSSLHVLSGGGIYEKLRHGVGMNFVPGPLTPFPGIKMLLASQVYDLKTGEICERPLLPNGIREYSGETTKVFSELFVNSLIQMRKELPGKLYIALTGGYDSRTLFSMMHRTGLDFKCYTSETEFMKEGGDVVLPPELCKKGGVEHIFLKRERKCRSRQRREDYLLHSSGMAKDGDYSNYIYGQFEKLRNSADDDVISLRSGVWGVAIEFYRIHSKGFKKQPTDLEDILTAFPDVRFDDLKTESLRQWLDWVRSSRYKAEINDADRFLWEERSGCWMSYISQAFDAIDGVRMFQPCNSRLFLSYLLSYPEEERIKKQHEAIITQYNMPEIKDIPYTNDLKTEKTPMIRRINKKFMTAYYIFKWYGMRALVKMLILRTKAA